MSFLKGEYFRFCKNIMKIWEMMLWKKGIEFIDWMKQLNDFIRKMRKYLKRNVVVEIMCFKLLIFIENINKLVFICSFFFSYFHISRFSCNYIHYLKTKNQPKYFHQIKFQNVIDINTETVTNGS